MTVDASACGHGSGENCGAIVTPAITSDSGVLELGGDSQFTLSRPAQTRAEDCVATHIARCAAHTVEQDCIDDGECTYNSGACLASDVDTCDGVNLDGTPAESRQACEVDVVDAECTYISQDGTDFIGQRRSHLHRDNNSGQPAMQLTESMQHCALLILPTVFWQRLARKNANSTQISAGATRHPAGRRHGDRG